MMGVPPGLVGDAASRRRSHVVKHLAIGGLGMEMRQLHG
jgi:hypothetical protein